MRNLETYLTGTNLIVINVGGDFSAHIKDAIDKGYEAHSLKWDNGAITPPFDFSALATGEAKRMLYVIDASVSGADKAAAYVIQRLRVGAVRELGLKVNRDPVLKTQLKEGSMDLLLNLFVGRVFIYENKRFKEQAVNFNFSRRDLHEIVGKKDELLNKVRKDMKGRVALTIEQAKELLMAFYTVTLTGKTWKERLVYWIKTTIHKEKTMKKLITVVAVIAVLMMASDAMAVDCTVTVQSVSADGELTVSVPFAAPDEDLPHVMAGFINDFPHVKRMIVGVGTPSIWPYLSQHDSAIKAIERSEGNRSYELSCTTTSKVNVKVRR